MGRTFSRAVLTSNAARGSTPSSALRVRSAALRPRRSVRVIRTGSEVTPLVYGALSPSWGPVHMLDTGAVGPGPAPPTAGPGSRRLPSSARTSTMEVNSGHSAIALLAPSVSVALNVAPTRLSVLLTEPEHRVRPRDRADDQPDRDGEPGPRRAAGDAEPAADDPGEQPSDGGDQAE